MNEFLSLSQVLVSLLVNGVGLSLALTMRNAPPRFGLFLCLFSMLAIFVPWTSLVVSNVDGNVRFDSLVISDQGLSTFVTTVDASGQSIGPNVMVAMFAVGLTWVVLTVVRSLRIRRRWRAESTRGDLFESHAHAELSKVLRRTTIRRLPGKSLVFSTGLLSAEIWIGDRIRGDAHIRTALNHELCHIAYRDQLTLFLVVILERLLWWNPLVWLLGQQARRQMEYACDARCQQLMGNRLYKNSLAELFLDQGPRETALGVSLGSGADIINRMERIGMTYSLTKTHVLALIIGSALIAAASTNLAAQEIEERPSLVQCHKLLPKNVQYDLKITSDIDTRGEDRNTIRMTLVDATKPSAEDEIPKEAGEFLKCLQKVIGVGDDEGWPEV